MRSYSFASEKLSDTTHGVQFSDKKEIKNITQHFWHRKVAKLKVKVEVSRSPVSALPLHADTECQ